VRGEADAEDCSLATAELVLDDHYLYPGLDAFFAMVRTIARTGAPIPAALLTRAAELTDASSAAFDAANTFAGSIAGVNEILAREALLAGNWCLSDHERLSSGQAAEIDRVTAAYPAITGSAGAA